MNSQVSGAGGQRVATIPLRVGSRLVESTDLPLEDFEKHFLIRLAPIWLACRWKIMGHPLRNWPYGSDLAFDLLGMVDYQNEMRLLCRQWVSRGRE
jgi:hypothetical protein